MDHVQQILKKVKAMLLKRGFAETTITNPYRSETNYVRGNLYCIPQYIEGLGFLMEYANSFEEAKNHGHEDGDSFPLEMGEDAILSGLENEVKQSISQ